MKYQISNMPVFNIVFEICIKVFTTCKLQDLNSANAKYSGVGSNIYSRPIPWNIN